MRHLQVRFAHRVILVCPEINIILPRYILNLVKIDNGRLQASSFKRQALLQTMRKFQAYMSAYDRRSCKLWAINKYRSND